jgi:hypothetical protein
LAVPGADQGFAPLIGGKRKPAAPSARAGWREFADVGEDLHLIFAPAKPLISQSWAGRWRSANPLAGNPGIPRGNLSVPALRFGLCQGTHSRRAAHCLAMQLNGKWTIQLLSQIFRLPCENISNKRNLRYLFGRPFFYRAYALATNLPPTSKVGKICRAFAR